MNIYQILGLTGFIPQRDPQPVGQYSTPQLLIPRQPSIYDPWKDHIICPRRKENKITAPPHEWHNILLLKSPCCKLLCSKSCLSVALGNKGFVKRIDYFRKQSKQKMLNLYSRSNPDGRINRKPDGRIFNQTAESIQNRTAKFDQTAEY